MATLNSSQGSLLEVRSSRRLLPSMSTLPEMELAVTDLRSTSVEKELPEAYIDIDQEQERAPMRRGSSSHVYDRIDCAPGGARSSVYRHDEFLEVDTPAKGCTCGFTALVIAFTSGLLGIIAIPAFFFTKNAIEKNPLWYLALLPVIICALLGLAAIKTIILRGFTHQNLVITCADFYIKRTLELRGTPRDSVNHADRFSEPLSWLARIFCSQAAGQSCDLIHAEILTREDSDGVISDWKLVLWEGSNRHSLEKMFTESERDWIADEINEFLEETFHKRKQ